MSLRMCGNSPLIDWRSSKKKQVSNPITSCPAANSTGAMTEPR